MVTLPKLQQQGQPAKVIWVGKTLTRYEFELYPIGTRFHPIPGIYIFCRQVTRENFQALYVGETDNLSRRLTTELASHHCLPDIRRAGATHICALVGPSDAAQRIEAETDLRHGLRPALNKQ